MKSQKERKALRRQVREQIELISGDLNNAMAELSDPLASITDNA